jgi:hypothetical protein
VNKFAAGERMCCRSGPLLARINHKKMLSFFSPGTPQPMKRKYREDLVTVHKIKPKIITSHSKLICSIDSSDIMLYTLG